MIRSAAFLCSCGVQEIIRVSQRLMKAVWSVRGLMGDYTQVDLYLELDLNLMWVWPNQEEFFPCSLKLQV